MIQWCLRSKTLSTRRSAKVTKNKSHAWSIKIWTSMGKNKTSRDITQIYLTMTAWSRKIKIIRIHKNLRRSCQTQIQSTEIWSKWMTFSWNRLANPKSYLYAKKVQSKNKDLNPLKLGNQTVWKDLIHLGQRVLLGLQSRMWYRTWGLI